MNMTKHQGFTLIELMIVVAIIGLLAAIGYPEYQRYLTRSYRAEAQTALIGLSAALERHASNNPTGGYAGAGGAGALPTAVNTGTPNPLVYPSQSPLTGTAVYALTISAMTMAGTYGNAYTLTATPVALGPAAGDGCGNLTLTNLGVKGRSGAYPLADCWK